MSTRAATARQPARKAAPKRHAAPPRPRAVAPRARRRTRPRILLIPLAALLLGGIVWLNVAKLAVTTETTRVVERSRAAEAAIAEMRGKLARQEAQVMGTARARGFTEIQSDAATFLQGVRSAP
jgi:hypothetical protein